VTGVVHTAPRRHLSERQAEAVDHLVDAAAIEVASCGYDALSMRGIAKRAGVATATAYTYFSSKDHVLGELLLRRVLAIPEPPGDPAADVAARLGRVVDDLGAITTGDPEVVAACTQALLSSNPDVKRLRDRIGVEVARRIARAADRPIDDRRVRVLVTTYFGALLMAGMGHMPYPDVPAFVAEAAGLMADPEGPR
jgi:AcrR family transcriptional regulator